MCQIASLATAFLHNNNRKHGPSVLFKRGKSVDHQASGSLSVIDSNLYLISNIDNWVRVLSFHPMTTRYEFTLTAWLFNGWCLNQLFLPQSLTLKCLLQGHFCQGRIWEDSCSRTVHLCSTLSAWMAMTSCGDVYVSCNEMIFHGAVFNMVEDC